MTSRPVLRFFSVAVLSGGLLLLGGCKSMTGGCEKPHAYSTAENLPPLHIPAGLDGPDTRSAVRVPELTEPAAPRGKNESCLEEPPKFDTAASTRPTR
jgi:uncharacterized lipoprotein